MKQDRGELAEKWAGIGNTVLFIIVLIGMFYLMSKHRYDFAIAVALAGIYAELWNMRVSRRK